ncbi:MAG TPA: RidA family protein [Actinomycetes bacterium]|nr:RidA family protein [Actinomycetes bacterium]
MSDLQRISSGVPWEDGFGYSRAVVAGPFVFVSGCTSILDGAIRYEGDPYQQAKTALEIAERALVEAGAAITDVVQSRIYIVHARDAEAVGRAHSEVFDAARPASTLVVVEGLIDPRLLVEIEVMAYLGGRGSGD